MDVAQVLALIKIPQLVNLLVVMGVGALFLTLTQWAFSNLSNLFSESSDWEDDEDEDEER